MPQDATTLAGRLLTPPQLLMLRQFIQFGLIGTLGFVLYTGFIYATVPVLGPYIAGIVGFCVVASINYFLNRFWTYRHLNHATTHKALLRFLVVNAIGFVLNYGTYAILIYTQPLFRAHLVLATGAGAVAGMFSNFFLSRRLVFR